MLNKYKINKKYVSPIDKFLGEFNITHPKTPPQLAEIKKYQRVYRLRDYPSKHDKAE